jgi:hypothetical protein
VRYSFRDANFLDARHEKPRKAMAMTLSIAQAIPMSDEWANNPAPKPPRCPNCAQPMRLVRRTQRFGGLSELFTFECATCGVSHIEAS